MGCKVLITPGTEWILDRKVLQIFTQSPLMPFTSLSLVSWSNIEFVAPFKILLKFETDMEHGPVFNKYLLYPIFVLQSSVIPICNNSELF